MIIARNTLMWLGIALFCAAWPFTAVSLTLFGILLATSAALATAAELIDYIGRRGKRAVVQGKLRGV